MMHVEKMLLIAVAGAVPAMTGGKKRAFLARDERTRLSSGRKSSSEEEHVRSSIIHHVHSEIVGGPGSFPIAGPEEIVGGPGSFPKAQPETVTDSGKKLGQKCAATADCAAPLECKGKVCKKKLAKLGQKCAVPADCAASLECKQKVCKKKTETKEVPKKVVTKELSKFELTEEVNDLKATVADQGKELTALEKLKLPGKVEDLEKEVPLLETKVDVETKVDDLEKNEVKPLEEKVEDLEGEVHDLEGQVENHDAQLHDITSCNPGCPGRLEADGKTFCKIPLKVGEKLYIKNLGSAKFHAATVKEAWEKAEVPGAVGFYKYYPAKGAPCDKKLGCEYLPLGMKGAGPWQLTKTAVGAANYDLYIEQQFKATAPAVVAVGGETTQPKETCSKPVSMPESSMPE